MIDNHNVTPIGVFVKKIFKGRMFEIFFGFGRTPAHPLPFTRLFPVSINVLRVCFQGLQLAKRFQMQLFYLIFR